MNNNNYGSFISLYKAVTVAKVTGNPKMGAYLRIDGRTKGKLREARSNRSSNIVAVALEDSDDGECLVQLIGTYIPITESTKLSLPVINSFLNNN